MVDTEEILGLAFIFLGSFLVVGVNALAVLLNEVPLLQMMQARFMLQLVLVLTLTMILRVWDYKINLLGETGKRHLLAMRSLSWMTGMGCLWGALRRLPIGEATSIIFFYPVLAGFLANQILQEKLGLRFYCQAVASSLGVLLVLNPLGGKAQELDYIGVALALASCCCLAVSAIISRMLKGLHPLGIQIWQDSLAALVFMPLYQLLMGSSMDVSSWDHNNLTLLVMFTSAGLVASCLYIAGFTMASTSKSVLFVYMEVPCSFLMQTIFFQQPLAPISALGASLIAGSAVIRLLLEMKDLRDAHLPVQKRTPTQDYASLLLEKIPDEDDDWSEEGMLSRCVSPTYGSTTLSEGFVRAVTEPRNEPGDVTDPQVVKRSATLC